MGNILEYFELDGLHALIIGGQNAFMGFVLEYFDARGLTPWL